jgi:cellulose synthase/poly-beta-1,6-N-acetylglucosamine synthase-like glycosyltransferase
LCALIEVLDDSRTTVFLGALSHNSNHMLQVPEFSKHVRLKISVGICAYNEIGNIANLISNLLKQPLFPNQELLEIIVVCSGCTDGTDNVVNDFHKKDARVKMVSQPSRRGKSSAQNIILREAKGDVIVFISADVYPAKGSIAVLADAIRENIGGANSKVLPLNKRQGFNFVPHFIWGLHNNTMAYENERGRLAHFTGEMFAIRRGIITSIPAYVVNDDAYVGMVVRLQGYRIRYCPEAICYNFGPCNAKDYLNQRRRILFGHRQLAQLLKKPPNTLETMMFYRPWDAIRILLEEIRQLRPQDLIKVLVVIALEVLAGLLALWDSYQKRANRYILWTPARSTKLLIKKK